MARESARTKTQWLGSITAKVLGITALVAAAVGLVNGAIDLYKAVAKVPSNIYDKTNDELFKKHFGKAPLLSQPVNIKAETVTVEMLLQVYETGDVFVRYGDVELWLPFKPLRTGSLALFPEALAQTRPGSQPSPKLPESQLSPKLPESQLSPKLPESQLSPKLPESQLSPKLPGSQLSPKLPESQLSPKLPESQLSPKLPESQLSPKQSGSQSSPNLPESQPSPNVPGPPLFRAPINIDIDNLKVQKSNQAPLGEPIIERSFVLARIKEDHPLLSSSTETFVETFKAEPGYKITKFDLQLGSAANYRVNRTELVENGRAVRVHFSLTSGPTFDRYRGWIQGTVKTQQEKIQ